MANPTTNLGMTKPTVGGSTDSWGTTLNVNVVDIIDALFSISGTDVTMSDIKFNSMSVQETGAGTDTVKIQAPSAVTTAYTLTMPAAVGSTNQVLSAADGTGTLAWTTPEVGDITSVADATNGGMTVTNGTGPDVTLGLNFNDLSAAAVNVANDSIAIIDADDSSTKKESIADLATAMGGTGLTGASGTLAVDASQTQITALGTIATGVWQGTAIANGYLANSTVSYGGVSLALGASNATPAFNLSNATAYTGDSSLVTVGTVAAGIWHGSTVETPYGGTGATSLTDGGILLGSGTGSVTATAVLADGEILIGDGTTDPVALDVGGSSAITILGTVATGTWQGTALATAYIADNAVTLAKLEDGTSGDILYYAASGVPTRLAKGSDTHVLTLSSGLPVWSASNVGDITGVIAGNGLTGGGDTGDVTLNVAGTSNRILVNANDVDIASTYVGQTSITTLGTIATGTWDGTAVAGNKGGTGLTSYTAGDIIYATGSTTLVKLGVGSNTEVLTLAGGVPTWAAPTTGDLTAIVAGAGLTGTSLSGPIPTLNVIGTSGTITVSADAITIASDYIGQSTITTLGTIGTGVWNGTAITGDYIDATSSPLANTKIWIGDSSGDAAEFALSGNATMTAGGVVTVSTAAACSGLAATATALATARTIGGTSFDGTANIAVGLSSTATALATARAINGTDFDGTAAITVTAAAGTLTGATLNSGVTASSLTSLGTIGSLVAATADINGGTIDAIVGGTTPADGSFTTLSATGDIQLTATQKFYLDGGSDTYISEPAADQILFFTGGGERLRIVSTQFQINTATHIAGDLEVTGAVSKGSGSFKIDHPLPAKKDTHHLVHSFLEGPQADLIYRGVVTLSGGAATVDIDVAAGMTAGTFELLCRDPQVWVQNDSGWSGVRGSVEGNILTIECKDTVSDDTVSWMVVAERCDPHIMETGWTDDDGRVIVEPEKESPLEPDGE